MGRSVMPCFRRRSFLADDADAVDDDSSAFCASLADGLRRLEESLAKDSISLKWSAEVMSLLKKMQAELLAVVKKSKLPITYGAEEDWFDQYMQETAALLDFCNMFKSAISGFNRYCMIVDLAIQILTKDAPGLIDIGEFEFERLERATGKVLDAKAVRETLGLADTITAWGNKKDEKGIAVVMLAAKTTMLVMSLLLFSALVSPISIDVGGAGINCSPPELKPCLEALVSISDKFRERFQEADTEFGSVLFEHKVMAEAARELKGQAVEAAGVERLKASSAELKRGVEVFEAMVDEVFGEVVRGRNEMLGVFRDGALGLGS